MKSILSGLVIILTLFTFPLLSKPILTFKGGNTYNFGNVKQKDSPLKADIMIYNTGEDTLVISRVKPMCGCTTAPLSKGTIAPNDSAQLKVTLSVEHYEGEIQKKITLQTNYLNQEIVLNLTANVLIPFKIFPGKYLNFSQMYIGSPTITKLILNNTSGHDIQFTGVSISTPDVTLNVKSGDVVLKDSDFVIEATARPTASGAFGCKVDLQTNDPDMPLLELTGWGRADDPTDKSAVDENAVPANTSPELMNVKPNNPPIVNPQAPVIAVPSEKGINNPKVDQIPGMKVSPGSRFKNSVTGPAIELKPEDPKKVEPKELPPSPPTPPKEKSE